MATIHEQIRSADLFILYRPLGPEIGEYRSAKTCANAVASHHHPEGLIVRGLMAGQEVFRMPAEEFGMTVFD